MNITVTFNIKRYKTALSKSYIDIHCQASADTSDSTSSQDISCIFMMQKLPKNALNQSTARFSHIADPVDLQDYPAEETQDMTYFRTNEITLRVRSQFQMEHIVETMRKEVKALVQALNALPDTQESFSQTFTA